MTKHLTVLLAAMFTTVALAPVAFAQEKKANPVAAACKDKKPGDVVKVDGKDVKCPAPKAAPAK
jgi:Cu/Ag efflux protein CusF